MTPREQAEILLEGAISFAKYMMTTGAASDYEQTKIFRYDCIRLLEKRLIKWQADVATVGLGMLIEKVCMDQRVFTVGYRGDFGWDAKFVAIGSSERVGSGHGSSMSAAVHCAIENMDDNTEADLKRILGMIDNASK